MEAGRIDSTHHSDRMAWYAMHTSCLLRSEGHKTFRKDWSRDWDAYQQMRSSHCPWALRSSAAWSAITLAKHSDLCLIQFDSMHHAGTGVWIERFGKTSWSGLCFTYTAQVTPPVAPVSVATRITIKTALSDCMRGEAMTVWLHRVCGLESSWNAIPAISTSNKTHHIQINSLH